MHSYVGARLSVMMFLQFFVWGAWYVTVGNYMATVGLGSSIGWVYTVGPIAALISPFFLGMIADRYFSTERVLAAMHILGGLALLFAPEMAELSIARWDELAKTLTAQGLDPATEAGKYFINPAHLPFIGIMLLHMLCYMPTLGLTNTIAFHNITNQEKQFPMIRVFGTIGWIVANVLVSLVLGADNTPLPLYVGGGGAILLGLCSLMLPHTPPPMAGKKASVRDILGLDAFALLKNPSFLTFVVSSMLICIPLAAYYAFAQNYVSYAGFAHPAFTMSFGQMSEIVFMLVMPWFFARLGVKWMLLVGMAAWFVRYGLFSLAADGGIEWMILAGIILHGICYDFFFVTGQIYVDKTAGPEIRGQAQGMLVLLTQGIGLGIGAQVMQRLLNTYLTGPQSLETAKAMRGDHAKLLEEAAASPDKATELLAQAQGLWERSTDLFLQSYDWKTFWLLPAVAAGIIFALFFLLFREPKKNGVSAGDVARAASVEELP